MTDTMVHSFQSSVAPAGASVCQVHEGGNVLRAGPSAHPLICDARTQQASRWLHTPAQGPTTNSVPLAVVALCPFLASNVNPSLLLLEAPPARHPLPSPLELALGSELWQIFAKGHARLTRNAAWGSTQKLHTGSIQTALRTVRTTGPCGPLFLPGPWTRHTMAPGSRHPLLLGSCCPHPL